MSKKHLKSGIFGIFQADKIFIGGLAQDVTESELRNYFGFYGALKSCDLRIDSETGGHRGYAFIRYMRPESRDKLLSEAEFQAIRGRSITVKPNVRDKEVSRRLVFDVSLSQARELRPNLLHFKAIGLTAFLNSGLHMGNLRRSRKLYVETKCDFSLRIARLAVPAIVQDGQFTREAIIRHVTSVFRGARPDLYLQMQRDSIGSPREQLEEWEYKKAVNMAKFDAAQAKFLGL